MMNKLLTIMLLAGLVGSASAYDAEYTWIGQHFGGDSVTFTSITNWTTDWIEHATTLPGTNSLVRIEAIDWLQSYPTLSGSVSAAGIYLGLNTTGISGALLTIAESGNVTTHPWWVVGPNFFWNPGFQIGWYSEATVTSAGTVNTLNSLNNGWTSLGLGSPSLGYGDGTLILTDGSWTTETLSYGLDSANHVQLHGGTLELWAISGLEEPNQTMDISGGTLVYHTTNANWFGWMTETNRGLTANGDVANLEGVFAADTWTVISLAAQSPLELYTTWASNYVGLVDTNMTADPDNDLLSNLGEYGLGGDPTDGNDQGNVPAIEILNVGGVDYFVYITYERDDKSIRGLNYNVEQTSNLVITPWTNGVATLGGLNPLNDEFNFVTNFVSTVDEDEQFLRLQVEFQD